MPRKRSTVKKPPPDAGRCVHCGKPKQIPPTRYVDPTNYVIDPYCSRRCLERALGVGDPDVRPGRQKKIA